MKVPTDPLLFALNVPARFAGGSTRSFATGPPFGPPEFSETEPNDDRKTATRVEFGGNLNGRLQKPGDVDHFVFRAKAGQSARFTAFARRLGSPADVVLRLTQADGSQLAYAEGAAANEATLSTSFPADGDYVLEVADLNRRGGPRYAYHVDVVPSDAGFSLAASADSLNIPAAGTATVTVTAVRSRYVGPIAVQAVDLPSGVTSVPTVIGPGQDSVVLSLRSAAGAATGRVHPIRIVGSARIRNADFQASATDHRGAQNGSGRHALSARIADDRDGTGNRAARPFALRTEPAELVFGRNLSATVKVIAERQKGFDEEIALTVVPIKTQPTNPPAGNLRFPPASRPP